MIADPPRAGCLDAASHGETCRTRSDSQLHGGRQQLIPETTLVSLPFRTHSALHPHNSPEGTKGSLLSHVPQSRSTAFSGPSS